MVNGQGNITTAWDGSVEAHPEGVNEVGLAGDIKYVYEGKCYNPSQVTNPSRKAQDEKSANDCDPCYPLDLEKQKSTNEVNQCNQLAASDYINENQGKRCNPLTEAYRK